MKRNINETLNKLAFKDKMRYFLENTFKILREYKFNIIDFMKFRSKFCHDWQTD